MSDRIKIFNGQIIHQNRIQSGGCLLIENGKVVDVPTELKSLMAKSFIRIGFNPEDVY